MNLGDERVVGEPRAHVGRVEGLGKLQKGGLWGWSETTAWSSDHNLGFRLHSTASQYSCAHFGRLKQDSIVRKKAPKDFWAAVHL